MEERLGSLDKVAKVGQSRRLWVLTLGNRIDGVYNEDGKG